MSADTNPISPPAVALFSLTLLFSGLTLVPGPSGGPPLVGPAPAAAQSLSEIEDRATREAELLAELATPGLETWEAVEARLVRLWSQSGSDTVDLLLNRGETAIGEEDYTTAIEHLTAVIDHAPDFAEGWHLRATAFYLIDEYGLALADLERALVLNPNHFGALTGIGVVLEEMGQYDLALRALRAAKALNPNSDTVDDTVDRLRFAVGDATL